MTAFLVLVAGAALVVLAGLGWPWLIPVALLAVVALLVSPIIWLSHRRISTGPPPGVPTTRQAAYDPVLPPRERE
jgi:cell division protein FtsW (lipid II flippase)